MGFIYQELPQPNGPCLHESFNEIHSLAPQSIRAAHNCPLKINPKDTIAVHSKITSLAFLAA